MKSKLDLVQSKVFYFVFVSTKTLTTHLKIKKVCIIQNGVSKPLSRFKFI